jgi:hypothetical protein
MSMNDTQFQDPFKLDLSAGWRHIPSAGSLSLNFCFSGLSRFPRVGHSHHA